MAVAMKDKEHTSMISMKTYVVFQGGVERVSFPNNEGWGLTCYEQQAKLNKLIKLKSEKLQAQNITHEVIKNIVGRGTN